MIKVHRPAQAPEVLRKEGAKKRRGLCSAYTRNPAKYTSGAGKFEFDGDIYAHDDVKTSLRRAQHGKCAFCESQITHISYGDVEHFRPKGAFRQGEAEPLERPGYYWLAYEWTNLLFSCQLCNQRHKKNEFPLSSPALRARSHRDAFTGEQPMFVDPSDPSDDPSVAISFREEIPYPKSKRGEETIRALGLKRPPLNQMRRDFLDALRATFVLAYALSPSESAKLAAEIQLARALLGRAVADSGQYAAMVRVAIPAWEQEFGVRAV